MSGLGPANGELIAENAQLKGVAERGRFHDADLDTRNYAHFLQSAAYASRSIYIDDSYTCPRLDRRKRNGPGIAAMIGQDLFFSRLCHPNKVYGN